MIRNLETDLMIADEKWHHFAVTFDNEPLPATGPPLSRPAHFYVDGVLADTRQTSGTGNLDNNGDLFILWHPDPFTTRGINGELDELTFYRQRLSAADISSIYEAGGAGKTPPTKTISNQQLAKCFAGETPVQVPGGMKRIDEMKPGDCVLSYDLGTNEIVETVVREVQSWQGSWKIARLEVDGGDMIDVVPHHYFLVDGEWRLLEALLGHVEGPVAMRTMSGMDRSVSWSEPRKTEDGTFVYNLKLADHHNYLVGGDGVLARDH